MEKVKITLHVTVEAAAILEKFGGGRNRGEWLSRKLAEWRTESDRADAVFMARSMRSDRGGSKKKGRR